jgi:hypothetical protein
MYFKCLCLPILNLSDGLVSTDKYVPLIIIID